MTDYSTYLIQSPEQLLEFEKRMGDKLQGQITGVFNWLWKCPHGEYFQPLAGIADEQTRIDLIQSVCWLILNREVRAHFNSQMQLQILDTEVHG